MCPSLGALGGGPAFRVPVSQSARQARPWRGGGFLRAGHLEAFWALFLGHPAPSGGHL